MGMDYDVQLDVSHKLFMTPQLRQAITILQLSSLELTAMVEQALLENPILEVDDASEEASVSSGEQAELAADGREQPLEEDFDWAEYFSGRSEDDCERIASTKEQISFELFTANGVSLHEYLEFQLHLALFDATDILIGKYLLGCLDDNGYLHGTIAEAAVAVRQSEAAVEQVLEIIQTFDPAGVGARDLQECLSIQMRQKGLTGSLALRIVTECLKDVAGNQWRQIAGRLGCDLHEVQAAVDIIRSFDPKPGSCFTSVQPGYIAADLAVEQAGDQYVVIVNDTTVPRLTINPYYQQVVREADSDAKRFVEERFRAAVSLMHNIEQRRRTLYHVMEAIVEVQREFFAKGLKYLRPLTMKTIAARVGLHESTISRTIANKYVTTPHGLFAMRAFFSAGLLSSSGEAVAAARVKQEIKGLVAQENTARPYSDQMLADMLKQNGIAVSRRTIAKYREDLGIAASSQRKRY